MEESKSTEDDKFIENVKDEVDVRIGAASNIEKEKTKKSEGSVKQRLSSLWPRKKVI